MAVITALVSRQLRARLRSADPATIDAWWETNYPLLERLVVTGHDVASTVTLRYLVDHAAAEGVLVAPVRVPADTAQIETVLRVTGPVALKRKVASSGSLEAGLQTLVSEMPRAATRMVLSGSRESTRRLVESDRRVIGYRRRTSGSPCAFCAMLASRGAVYKTAESAGDGGHRYHADCSCTQEPVYAREPDDPETARYAELWREAKASAPDGVPAATQFRRLVEDRA